jgi:hypothetical protein
MTAAIGKSGIIEDFFTDAELDSVLKYLSNLKTSEVFNYGNGIDESHHLYAWFVKKCFNKIQQVFGQDLRLARVTYLNDNTPIILHSDYYQMNSRGTPRLAMLIPISSNNDRTFKNKVNTVIFNEEDTFTESNKTVTKFWTPIAWNKNKKVKDNNAMQYKEQYLSHLKDEDLECLTVGTVAEWKFGSIIYWDERLLHTSDNFLKNNINSKQALVLHTYVL